MNLTLKKVLSCIITVAAALTAVFVAPPEISPVVTASAAELSSSGWSGSYSVDNSTHPADCTYSVKVVNDAYKVKEIKRSFKVKSNTQYLFTAKVKYSGYELDSEAEVPESGACIGKTFSRNHSAYSTSGDWTQLSYVFTTEKETEYELSLYNGMRNAYCKGTAWFADIELVPYTADNSVWYSDYSADFTVTADTLTKYKDYPYSIKIENKNYGVGIAKRHSP